MNGFGLSDDRLREAMARRAARAALAPTCPEPGVLWDLASGVLRAAEARRLASHAVSCGACREALSLAREAGATGIVGSTGRLAAARTWRPWPMMAAAAAAAAVAVVGLVVWNRDTAVPVPPVFRLTPVLTIESLTPSEALRTDAGFALRWTEIPGATYEVTLARRDLEVLDRIGGLASPTCPVPAGVVARLAPGEPLLWQVAARTADGRTIRSRTFTIRLE